MPFDLSGKRNLQEKIETLLHPQPNSIKDVNLEHEMVQQYRSLRQLQESIINQDHEDIPSNQKAQVANSVTNSLIKLADLQNSLYTSERFKRIEQILIKVLRLLPEETAEQFLNEYEQLIN